MKKLLTIALVSAICVFMSVAEAAVETYIGVGNATMNETETQEQVFNRAKGYALRRAAEQAGVYVVSQSKLRDLELVEDEIVSITGGLMKITDTKVEKALLGGEVLQVTVTLTVQIDSDELQREIDRRLENQRPKTPIDRPKPLEQPKPPVEHSQPPIRQPKPPVPTIDQPIEQPTIEPPAPTVEPIEPSAIWLSDEQIMTSDLLELINAEREKIGKKPFTRNSVLVKGAKLRAEELTRKWSNERPNGQSWWTVLPLPFQQKSSWEYIHSGYDNPQKIVDWYMSQSDNKILSSDYSSIGIAYFYKGDSDKKHYWVVILS